ncbi:hypothetical protein EJB05_29868 [Eragrostis curvula]|uniref:Uncharacterized protein n=1 Tax=Eragrostis curvula TaxID=38414 RepID=A0A5J9UVI1_9POAL|nr:hypothetical protein EJB05_29868 [Eragrostis curvula]
MPLRLRTPLQQPEVSEPLPVAYAMHGARLDPTWPQVIAADASVASSATTTAKATRACFLFRAISASVERLRGNGTETPHLPGTPATVPMLILPTLPARLLRHRHAA